eukprot:461892-Lingulodinium_polyedra.AAC.1
MLPAWRKRAREARRVRRRGVSNACAESQTKVRRAGSRGEVGCPVDDSPVVVASGRKRTARVACCKGDSASGI